MSSLGTVGGSLSSLLAAQNRRVDHDGDEANASLTPAQRFSGKREQAFNSALSSIGLDQTKIDAIDKQVVDALQSLPAPGATNGVVADPRVAARKAIDDVLQKNGVDVGQFRAALRQEEGRLHRGQRHGGGAEAGNAASSGQQIAQIIESQSVSLLLDPGQNSTTDQSLAASLISGQQSPLKIDINA